MPWHGMAQPAWAELVLVLPSAQVSFQYVRRVVEKELGLPLEEVFAEFSFVPAATASIAQVHFAVLRPQALELVLRGTPSATGSSKVKHGRQLMVQEPEAAYGEGLEVAVKVQLGNRRSIMNDVETLYRTGVLLKMLDLDGGLDSPVICKAYSTLTYAPVESAAARRKSCMCPLLHRLWAQDGLHVSDDGTLSCRMLLHRGVA